MFAKMSWADWKMLRRAFLLKPTPFSDSEFARRKQIELLPGFWVYVASPEDVILKKLEYFREGGSEKHLGDIRGMLAETEIDLPYLLIWIEKLGVTAEWQKAQ